MSMIRSGAERNRKRPAPGPALSNKRLKQKAAYHSSSSEDEAEPLRNDRDFKKAAAVLQGSELEDGLAISRVQLPNLESEGSSRTEAINSIQKVDTTLQGEDASDEDASLGSDVEDDSEADDESSEDETSLAGSSQTGRKKSKRHDPEVFANSIQRILSSKLTSSKRADPMLSRSAAAQDAAKTLTEQKLDKAARRKLRADKKAEKEKGHDKDVLGLNRADVSTAEVVEAEKMLKRTAQKGVVKLFNAVRAAQMGGLQAEREAQGEAGRVIGVDSRKKKVDEMSKQGFLDLLAGGKANGT